MESREKIFLTLMRVKYNPVFAGRRERAFHHSAREYRVLCGDNQIDLLCPNVVKCRIGLFTCLGC